MDQSEIVDSSRGRPGLIRTGEQLRMEGNIEQSRASDPLDRVIDLAAVRWSTVVAALALLAGSILRLIQLDIHALSSAEANWAFDSFLFYRGQTPPAGEHISSTGPLAIISQAASFFLFGVTDATARIPGALFGIGAMALVLGLRPFFGRPAVTGILVMMAISPTLVLASRNEPTTSAGVFSLMLVLVSLMRAGDQASSSASRARWAAGFGIGLGMVIGSGPAALSGLVALAFGIAVSLFLGNEETPARLAFREFFSPSRNWVVAGIGLIATLLLLFTRLFTELSAIDGLLTTFADWGRLIATTSSNTPGQFFLLAILLYEFFAVLFAIVALWNSSVPHTGKTSLALFVTWFLVALILFSLSSGRAPEQAAYVALPLLLLAGIGLGDVVARVDPLRGTGARGWAFIGVSVLFFISLAAVIVLAGRISGSTSPSQAWLDLIFVCVLVLIPSAVTGIYLLNYDKKLSGRSRGTGWILVTVALVLGFLTVRAATQLSYANITTSNELLAQKTSTEAVLPLIDRLRRISLDQTRTEGTVQDPTGGHGLAVAIDRRVEQPFAWYFRDFPAMSVTPAGQATSASADIVIAPDDTGMAEGGYTVTPYNTKNRVPGAYSDPNIGDILSGIFLPSHWQDSIDFLLYRELQTPAVPESVQVGMTSNLSAQVEPSSGPYSLLERVGPGSADGQFDGPRGLSVGPDGSIYVVDSNNARIERFDPDGNFVAAFGGSASGLQLTISSQGLGPTGIATGADGLIYVADTWGHRVVMLDPSGTVIRTWGTYADNLDSQTAEQNPGGFFGPRGVAVTNDEIYVVDTGNERVEVFGKDGSFKRAFGGNGSAPSQLIEPVGIAVGPDGNIYVADSGNARISIFSPEGAPIAQWPVTAWAGHSYFEPYLAFDEQGLLYATSSATGSVEVIGKDGQLLGTITTSGNQAFKRPTGIALDRDGTLLVSDTGSSAVYRIDPLPVPDVAAVAIGVASPEPTSASNLLPPASPVASPAGSPAATPEP